MKDASVIIPGDTPAPESFWRTMWQDSRVRAVLGLALLIRLLILGYLVIYPGGIFAKGDSKDYLQLAQNLHYYHSFAREPMETPKDVQKLVVPPVDGGKKVTLIPETFRTPVYPVFLALIYGVSGSPFPAVVAQSLLSLVTVWLIILLMARLFRPEAGWLAGLLAALDPLGLTYTHQLMTESLFLFFILLGLYVFLILVTADNQKRVNLPWAILGGLAIGLATLTRPVGIYFPIFLMALWIIGAFWGGWQTLRGKAAPAKLDSSPPLLSRFAPGFKSVIVFLVVALLPPALWSVRNYHFYHRFLVSTSADHNLLTTITSHIVAKIRNPEGNISSWEIYEELEKELADQMARQGFKNPSEPERAVYFRNWSLGVIKDHPGLFTWYYFKGMAILFIPDVAGFYELCGVTKEGKGALGAVFRQGLRPALTRYFGEHWPLWVAIAMPLIIYDLGVYGLAIFGVAVLWRSRKFYLLFIILSIIGYWLALAAIGAAPRYRLPLMPFLIILSAWGLFNLGTRSPVGGR